MKFEVRKTALQNKLTFNSIGKQRAERLLIYQVLRCFRVVSCLKPILDCFKMFIGSRDHYE